MDVIDFDAWRKQRQTSPNDEGNPYFTIDEFLEFSDLTWPQYCDNQHLFTHQNGAVFSPILVVYQQLDSSEEALCKGSIDLPWLLGLKGAGSHPGPRLYLTGPWR